jgi:short-subunit dehydrogenase
VRPIALITGASAGIGVALAREFARHGHILALVARREERLQALANEIAASGATRPLVIAADLTKPDAGRQLAAALAASNAEPQYVVNNAGFGLVGLAENRSRDQQLAMIDLNMRVLTELSLLFVDSLSRHRGGILNVGSIAGFVPGPGMAVYYASKAYVVSLSRALRAELKPRDIRVTVLCPGPVRTEFDKVAGMTAFISPSFFVDSAEKVARVGYRGLMAGRAVVVPGLVNKLFITLGRWVPRGLLLAAIGAAQSHRTAA